MGILDRDPWKTRGHETAKSPTLFTGPVHMFFLCACASARTGARAPARARTGARTNINYNPMIDDTKRREKYYQQYKDNPMI